MRCISIDPGASTGWALWENEELIACGACEPEQVRACVGTLARVGVAAPPIEHVIVEVPQKYPNDRIDPNNLITLGVSAGIAVGMFLPARVRRVFPREWKAQMPKAMHHPMIYGALSLRGRAVVDVGGRGLRGKALGDLMDAVGLGLYAITRGLWR